MWPWESVLCGSSLVWHCSSGFTEWICSSGVARLAPVASSGRVRCSFGGVGLGCTCAVWALCLLAGILQVLVFTGFVWCALGGARAVCIRRGSVLWNPVGGGTDAKWLLGKKVGSLEGG